MKFSQRFIYPVDDLCCCIAPPLDEVHGTQTRRIFDTSTIYGLTCMPLVHPCTEHVHLYESAGWIEVTDFLRRRNTGGLETRTTKKA